ncbi:hypothetical protein PIB30_061821 [Stylosanthes scabra]|uniref:Uncharacterized protein n=1 Tax=Stylosanthes scabra TaxID=79078 RepID=A0ABU6YL85_9FABA|nr:hypothetical protein [Stylosanthes scabra]
MLTWGRIIQSGSNEASIRASNLKTLNKSARWETTHRSNASLTLLIWHTHDLPPPAKGKAKAYGPPTRASPRLTTLRSQAAVQPQPETPVTPGISGPTSSLPPKKRPIQREAGECTSKAAATPIRRHSQRIATLNCALSQAPKELEVIAISSDSETKTAKDDDVEAEPKEELSVEE